MARPRIEVFLRESQTRINSQLESIARKATEEFPSPIGDAIAYGLLAPGKRFRPSLALAVYQEFGGLQDIDLLATAIEIVHTYSLVHDDLPCMDNDAMRRGRATTHEKFDVGTATEAAFRMVPLAARVLAEGAQRAGLDAGEAGNLGAVLFEAAGASGMVGGQAMDLEAEGRQVAVADLVKIHSAKTGALIAASAVIGALAARVPQPQVAAAKLFGEELGLAFQIIDDILDSTGTSEQLGKTAGKDEAQNKATFTTMLSETEACEWAEACVGRAVDRLGDVGIDSDLLNELGLFIINRRS